MCPPFIYVYTRATQIHIDDFICFVIGARENHYFSALPRKTPTYYKYSASLQSDVERFSHSLRIRMEQHHFDVLKWDKVRRCVVDFPMWNSLNEGFNYTPVSTNHMDFHKEKQTHNYDTSIPVIYGAKWKYFLYGCFLQSFLGYLFVFTSISALFSMQNLYRILQNQTHIWINYVQLLFIYLCHRFVCIVKNCLHTERVEGRFN